MTTLAETPKIAKPVIRWVVIQVRGCQHDACLANAGSFDQIGPSCHATLGVPPRALSLIKPTPVEEATQPSEVRATAFLAPAAGALEAHATALSR